MARASNGRGSVFRSKDTNGWEGLVSFGYDADGRRLRKKVRGRTRREVQAKVDRLTVQAGNAQGPIDSTITVSEWVHQWAADQRGSVQPNTLSGYRTDLTYVDRSGVGSVRLDRVSVRDIDALYKWMVNERGLSRGSVEHVRATIRPALNLAVAQGYLASNPVPKVAVRGTKKPPNRPYGDREMERLIAASWAVRSGVRWLLGLLGMRRGEVLGLRWVDVDLERGELNIVHSLHWREWAHGCEALYRRPCGRKQAGRCPARVDGGPELGPTKTPQSQRLVILPSHVVAHLRAHRQAQEAERAAAGDRWESWDLVIATATGGPVNWTSDYDHWDEVRVAASLRRVRIHDLRHAMATWLEEQGEGGRGMQGVFGWASAGQTERYVRVTPKVRRRIADRQEALFFASAAEDAEERAEPRDTIEPGATAGT